MIERQRSSPGVLRAARYRTVWISDPHLGTRGCKAEILLDFLHATEAQTPAFVGDIVDDQQRMRWWYWTAGQSDVVQRLLEAESCTSLVEHDDGRLLFAELS